MWVTLLPSGRAAPAPASRGTNGYGADVVISIERTRQLALALPEVVEQDHHGRPSFRVAGRIFATLWDEHHLNVMLDEPGIHTATQGAPESCREFWWGKRLGAVSVDLAAAGDALVAELLTEAWELRAPRRLLQASDTALVGASAQTASVDELMERFGLGEDDRDAWAEERLPVGAFEDWLIDRVARRPAGLRARATYGAPGVHDFARRAILGALKLEPGDRLLEIGCGGGLLLAEALASSARVTGLDHSEEMVELARERVPAAEVVHAGAEHLPFPRGSFTAIAMSVVFMFLSEPETVLGECRRVLAPGGRIAIYTSSPRLRGTPAAPEPLASHSHFYEDAELIALAAEAGFRQAAVADDDGGQLLTAVA